MSVFWGLGEKAEIDNKQINKWNIQSMLMMVSAMRKIKQKDIGSEEICTFR